MPSLNGMPRKGLVSRLRRALRRVLDLVPPTPLGLAVTAGAGWLLWAFAYAQLDLVVLAAGWGAIGLVALANLSTVAAAILVDRRLRRHFPPTGGDPITLEAGRPSPTGATLPALTWFPFVQLGWRWEAPPDSAHFPAAVVESRRGGQGFWEVVTLQERTDQRRVRRRAEVGDVFGLARIALRRDAPTPVRALPQVGRLGTAATLQSLAGGDEQPHPMGLVDGDRVDLRRYVPGDPARFIHWKVFGRTRKLVVRTPERSLSRARRTLVYLVAGRDDEASAAACRLALAKNAFGDDWTLSADGAGGDTSRPEEALAFVVRSVAHRDRGAEALASFLERGHRAGPAALVLFVPPRPGPWVDRVAEAARRRSRPPRVVIGVDGLAAAAPAPRWWRALAADPPPAGSPLAELEQVVERLAGAGCEVTVHDRVSGRLLGREARRRVARRATASGPRRAGGPSPRRPAAA